MSSLAGAMAKTFQSGFGDRKVCVTFFTNTPQFIQIYFIFFGLPARSGPIFLAVLAGMTLNGA
jgi:polar amino acid transport system permease protein